MAKSKKRVFRGITIPAAVVLICVIVLIVIGTAFLPIWQIKTITVLNNSYVPSSYILGKLNIPKDVTLFTIRTKDISAPFANDRYVKGVTLQRKFQRTLVLAMHIREPFYKATLGDELYIFDEEGMVLNAQNSFKVPAEKCFELSRVKAFRDIPRIVTELKPAIPQLKTFNDPKRVVINCRNLDAIQVVY